jgi:nucleoside phosphorylase
LVGIAGGFPKRKVHRGDVIVANVIHSFDYGKLMGGAFVRRPELDIVCDRGLLAYAEVTASSKEQGWRSYIEEKRPDRKGRKASTAHVDCYVASSDKVVDDPGHPFYSAVEAAFPEIHAVEMEGLGAGASARLAQIEGQAGFLMIRGISDEPGNKAAAGSGQRSAWRAYAANAAAAFTRAFIEGLELPTNHGGTTFDQSPGRGILNGDERLLQRISDALEAKAPQYARVFSDARTTAQKAFECADQAAVVAQRARTILAKRLAALEIPEGERRVLTAESRHEGLGRLGIVLWNSGDEYAGQVSQRTEDGLGQYKIYLISKRFTPNQISRYSGQLSGGKFGPYGVMDFPDLRTFAGRWDDARPGSGYYLSLDTYRPYEYYFGDMGEFKGDHGPMWIPHGYGVGVSMKRKTIVFGTFERGEPRSSSADDVILIS